MQIAIIGLPGSGKSTLFNALTGGSVAAADFSGRQQPRLGVARVPDARVDALVEMFTPRRTVYAEITYVDLPEPPPGAPAPQLVRGEAMTLLQQADALILVLRAFEEESVPHPKGGIDWVRDARDGTFDLLFADIALIDRRVERIEAGMKALRAAQREALLKDIEVLRSIQSVLESGTPMRALDRSDAQRRVLRDTFLVSALPLIYVLNIGESDLGAAAALEKRLAGEVAGPVAAASAVCAGLEQELAQMPPEEADQFRRALGAEEHGVGRIAETCQRAAGVISFLTVGDDEVRAWTIADGTRAARAAGHVHSDMERGFIRAEVVSFDDLVATGGLQEARRAGVLRSEGRDYTVRDGDVINFLFSV